MSLLPPQTISLKRRRNEAPVDALRFDDTDSSKRRKRDFAYRRVTKPDEDPMRLPVPPTPITERRFQLEAASISGAKRVFVESRPPTRVRAAIKNGGINGQAQPPAPPSTPDSAPRPRKRPGAASALHRHSSKSSLHQPIRNQPSETDLRTLEALSNEIDRADNLLIPLPNASPSKHRPKAPAQRFADRNPDKAAALDTPHDDGDAMDIDTDDYVIETYIREPLLPNAPLPTGTVGLLVLDDDDDDWWNGDESASEKFDTDDEDENAEDYYANDYPEDELSEDDELGRDVYQQRYRHGSDDEEWGASLDEEEDVALGSGEDEDDLHFAMTVPKAQRVGYWGAMGET